MARQALYTEQISALVTEDMKELVDRLDGGYPHVSKGDVIRLALEKGLPLAEKELAKRHGQPATTGS